MNPKDLVGAKKAPLGVVPPSLVPFVAPAMAVGASKYGAFNWREQPVQMMTYLEAAQRHILAFVDGQDLAEDTGISHIAHALAGLAIVADAIASGNVIDNRPLPGPTPDILRAQDHSVIPAVDQEMKTYPAPFTGQQVCFYCGCTIGNTTDHTLDCPVYGNGIAQTADRGDTLPDISMHEIVSEEWGNGDGELFALGDTLDGPYYIGVPFLEPDGCFNYRGKHVHRSVADAETFRDIDRDMARG